MCGMIRRPKTWRSLPSDNATTRARRSSRYALNLERKERAGPLSEGTGRSQPFVVDQRVDAPPQRMVGDADEIATAASDPRFGAARAALKSRAKTSGAMALSLRKRRISLRSWMAR